MTKRLVTVRIDEELHELAKELGLNMSFLLELAILRVAKIRGVDITPYLKKILSTKRPLSYSDIASIVR